MDIQTIPSADPKPVEAASSPVAGSKQGRRGHRLPHQGALLRHLQSGSRHRDSDQEKLHHRVHRTFRMRQEHGVALPESDE